MVTSRITTREQLHDYLYSAMQLEHATIPPYLMALYSIHPGTNSDAYHILRVIVVEEMLHLTLAANILNAVGGKPDLTRTGFVPNYPSPLPDGEDDFQVSVERFSKQSLETFLKIERPAKAPTEEKRMMRRQRAGNGLLGACPVDTAYKYYSIGEFYEEIERGIDSLYEKDGSALFSGDPSHQVTSEYYYSGGGKLLAVTDLKTAKEAIRLIIEQGEGMRYEIFNHEGELSHYFRFQQLKLGQYYEAGNEPDKPTGPTLTVDWNAVYPIKTDASLTDYPAGSQVRAAAEDFNKSYAEFLAIVTRAYNGNPSLLLEAVPKMFSLRDKVNQLIHNPMPGESGVNAAPTFEIDAVRAVVAS